MSDRIITLFGEEIIPEHLRAVGRSRAKKKNEEKAEPSADAVVGADQPPVQQVDAIAAVEPEQAEVVVEASQPIPAEIVLGKTEAAVVDTAQNDIVEVPAIENNAPEKSELNIAAEVAEAVEPMTTVAEEAVVDISEPVADVEAGPITATAQEEPASTPGKKERAKLAELPDDWQGNKKYYSIGEVADIFKVKTSHIRFWTNEFKLKVRTTRKGDRLYTPEQIKELRTINSLVKERGFTIKGAKTRLKAPEKMEVETVDLKQSLLHLRNKLVAIKNQLK